MRGWEQQVQCVVREFGTYLSNRIQKPLEIKQVWDRMWTPEDEANLMPTDWEKLTGVYLFADVCKADGGLSDGQDQYSVIHRLGIAMDRSYGDRLADYGYPEKRPHAYYYHKKRESGFAGFAIVGLT